MLALNTQKIHSGSNVPKFYSETYMKLKNRGVAKCSAGFP